MAKKKISSPQNYPRFGEASELQGFLDDSKVSQHIQKICVADLKKIIAAAVEYANRKSSREILEIPQDATDEKASEIYFSQGRKLFDYFKKYCGDPATTAYQCKGRHYIQV